jgi:hypothetical protein
VRIPTPVRGVRELRTGPTRPRRAAVLVAVVVTPLTLASVAGAAGAATTPPGHLPVAFGSVAAISGTSMEVQSVATGQTTVDWTPGTTFSHTVAVGASALFAGECVTVTGSTSKGVIKARSVAIAPAASSGTCAPGASPGGTVFHSQSGKPPSGAFAHWGPTSLPGPKGAHGKVTANAFGIGIGKVTRVAGASVTLRGLSLGGRPVKVKSSKSTTKQAKKRAAPKVTTVHVKLGSRTTFTEVEATSASGLAVGDCVAASGTAASNGTISAKSVSIVSAGGRGGGTPKGTPAGGAGQAVQIGV